MILASKDKEMLWGKKDHKEEKYMLEICFLLLMKFRKMGLGGRGRKIRIKEKN